MDIGAQISQLYDQNPEARTRFARAFSDYERRFPLALKMCEDNPPIDLTIEGLESTGHGALIDLLAHLPVEVVHEEFGGDVLLWMWFSDNEGSVRKDLTPHINAITGLDSNLLSLARMTAWQEHRNYNLRALLSIYDFNQTILNQAEDLNMEQLLRMNAKGTLSEDIIGKYRMSGIRAFTPSGPALGERHTRPDGKEDSYSIYIDTPTALVLRYQDCPNAVIGALPVSDTTVLVKQIQGVNSSRLNKDGKFIGEKSPWGIHPLHWRRLLVKAVEIISRDLGYERIGIQGVDNNHWVGSSYSDGTPRITRERVVKGYDVPAEEFGFAKEDNGNWYLSLVD